MEKSVQITLIIVVGIVVLFGMTYSVFTSFQPDRDTITGNGEASLKAVPDLVAVYFNVEAKGGTSEEATQENAEIVDNLLTGLIKLGLERDDIQTQNFNIYPNYEYRNGQRIETGYRATHSVRVVISTEDSSLIGDIIDAGVSAGSQISYINWELSPEKQSKYKAEALKLAAQDAKLKAEAIAEGLDKKLGKLVSTSQSNFNYNPWRMYDMAVGANVEEAKAATTNISPSEQDITARITVVYKLR
jgi:uncharacterized protein